MNSTPNFHFEKKFWKRGFRIVAGADEVGRGSLAGPVVTACVAFAPRLTVKQLDNESIRIDDSKKLSPRKREIAEKWIKKNALSYGIGEASVSEINRLGIAKATHKAFRSAIHSFDKRIDYLLIDAFYIPFIKGIKRKKQLAIIDGDEKSISIAAASIIAKVYRDRLMSELSGKYPKYGWVRNKGYGTKDHQEAIKKYGTTKHHRKVFVETFLNNSSFSQAQSKT